MAVKAVPDGYHTITPYLTVKGAAGLIGFLKQAFDAEEISRLAHQDGTVANAEVRIGDSMMMIAEARPEWPPSPCAIYLYVEDTDALYRRAVAAGAVSLMEPADMFYGDRNAGVKDPCGNSWWIATHIEDLTPAEIERRAAEHMH